jgi:hypothetical protein
MFCRNDTEGPGGKESGPIYRVMDSLVENMTGAYIPQIVPNKTRCGNLDPVEMNQTNKCFCLSKDGKGAGMLYNKMMSMYCLHYKKQGEHSIMINMALH